MKIILLSLAFLVSFIGCATRHHVADDYNAVLEASPKLARQTVIVFLIDGLSEQTLQASLIDMPNVKTFFNTDRGMYRAHAPFPSLTFPGISSLLKGKPVSQTGFIGNSFYLGDEVVNFEKPLKRKTFGELMETDSIFSRLKARGERSVSLDYGLGINASAYSPIEDLSSVLEIADGNYDYADSKKIEAVELLLSKNRPEHWPSFIFVHLIGVDFLAHGHGPLAASTLAYTMSLDEKLKPLLELLKETENKHSIVTVITADHGFASKINYALNIEQIVSKLTKKSKVLNESRMAAVYLRDQNSKDYVSEELLKHKGIEIVARKTDSGFTVASEQKKLSIEILRYPSCKEDGIAISIQKSEWICPSALSAEADPFKHPFFISNLAHYFAAKTSPDLVVIPDSETAFSKDYVGLHGGPTAEETMVPVLMRNSTMSSGQAPPLWRLLDQLIK